MRARSSGKRPQPGQAELRRKIALEKRRRIAAYRKAIQADSRRINAENRRINLENRERVASDKKRRIASDKAELRRKSDLEKAEVRKGIALGKLGKILTRKGLINRKPPYY